MPHLWIYNHHGSELLYFYYFMNFGIKKYNACSADYSTYSEFNQREFVLPQNAWIIPTSSDSEQLSFACLPSKVVQQFKAVTGPTANLKVLC